MNTEKFLFDIYKASLKINSDLIINEVNNELSAYNYNSKYIDITFFAEEKGVDINSINEEINKLKESIARRQKLLANENYVNKAPIKIVELDRAKLLEEKSQLENLKKII